MITVYDWKLMQMSVLLWLNLNIKKDKQNKMSISLMQILNVQLQEVNNAIQLCLARSIQVSALTNY